MHQIRYFLAVCETLNFTRAAEACHVSQPSLTRAIKGLEDELGGPLFRRERNNTHLTGLGEMMRPHLSQVLIETETAKERARSFGRLEDVELKLGMMCTIGPHRFVPFLQAFRERHPKVRLVGAGRLGRASCRSGWPQAALDVADLRPARGHRRPLPRAAPLRRALRHWRLSGPSPSKSRTRCGSADLDGQAYVNRSECEFFGHAGRLWREQGAKVSMVFRSDRDDWVQSMALAGLGFTFIPEYAVTVPGLCVRPLIEPEIVRTIQVVTVRGRPHLPSVGAFVREVLAFPWVNAGARAGSRHGYRNHSHPAFSFGRAGSDAAAIAATLRSRHNRTEITHVRPHSCRSQRSLPRASAVAAPAFAGECPADKMRADSAKPVTHGPKGVTDKVLSQIDLGEREGRAQGPLNARAPAGSAAGRHRALAQPRRPSGADLRRVGRDRREQQQLRRADPAQGRRSGARNPCHVHWWKNNGKAAVMLLSFDIHRRSQRPQHVIAGGRVMSGVLRAFTIGLTAFLTVVDLFATQAILPALTRPTASRRRRWGSRSMPAPSAWLQAASPSPCSAARSIAGAASSSA